VDSHPYPADPVDAAIAAANVLMGVAARSVQRVEDEVTSLQLRVLMLIELGGPQSPSAVAAELGVHASNATRTCDKLVQSRLISRREDPSDRRFIRLELTDRGKTLVERVIAERRATLARILHDLPAEQLDQVAAGLRIFATAAGSEPSRDGRFTLGTS
jgi:DNA-binding MarR family transcriptional regulator